MHRFLEGIVINISCAGVGAAGARIYQKLSRVQPTQRLWQLRDPENLIISAAMTCEVNTGEEYTGEQYYRPNTGLGELRALGLVMSSLKTAYNNIQIKNVLLSTDPLGQEIDKDLILLGGPKHNQHTEFMLSHVRGLSLLAYQERDTIYWRVGEKERVFKPKVEDKKVVRDYGLIIRMSNPLSHAGNTFCLFSGGHTYGVVASAKYFTERYYERARRWGRIGPNLLAVVGCQVLDGCPVDIRLEAEYIFDNMPVSD